jgi:hypothetical protein
MDTLSGVVFSSTWAVETRSPAIFGTSVTALNLSLASSRPNGGGFRIFVGTTVDRRRRRTQNTHKLGTPVSLGLQGAKSGCLGGPALETGDKLTWEQRIGQRI